MNMLFLLSHIANSFDAPIMGWSSWNTYRVNINESLIQLQADAMVSKGLKDAGYSNIHIDDGFFGYRDETTGILHQHETRFPSGMKAIADYIRSKGLIPGIYSDAGPNTCGSIWDNDKNGIHVGLYGYEEQDADLYFNQWGFEFIKIDYCGAGQQLNIDEEQRYKTIKQAIDKIAKRKVSINVCRWAYPGHWVREVGRSWRTTPDISASFWSVTSIIKDSLYLAQYAGEGHYNDLDMLEVGRGLPLNQEEVHFGMWCIMSSPLLIGCDLTKIPDATLKLITNKELIALNQDPLGLQAHVIHKNSGGYVLIKDIEKKHGTVRAISFYNPTNKEISFEVPLSELEVEKITKLRDLIKNKDLEATDNYNDTYIKATVPAESVKIYKLTASKRTEATYINPEWAFLSKWNNLGKRTRFVSLTNDNKFASGMKIVNLGGEKENNANYTMYSISGGKYEIQVEYFLTNGEAYPPRELRIEVNGAFQKAYNVSDLKKDELSQTDKIEVTLKAGDNFITLYSPTQWLPAVGRITLTKKE